MLLMDAAMPTCKRRTLQAHEDDTPCQLLRRARESRTCPLITPQGRHYAIKVPGVLNCTCVPSQCHSNRQSGGQRPVLQQHLSTVVCRLQASWQRLPGTSPSLGLTGHDAEHPPRSSALGIRSAKKACHHRSGGLLGWPTRPQESPLQLLPSMWQPSRHSSFYL